MGMLNRVIRAFDSRVRRIDVTVNFNDADVAVAALTANLDRSAFVLPADAVIVGTALNVVSDFDNGAGSACKLDIGISGSNTIFLAGAADNLGIVGRTNGGTTGTTLPSFQGGVQVRMGLTCSVNLSTETKGQVVVSLFYIRADFLNDAGRG